MKTIGLGGFSKVLLFLFMICIYVNSQNLESRFAGVVSDIKIIDIDNQKDVILWVKTDDSYLIRGKGHIPAIYVGDSLYEYWMDYRKIGVGTISNKIIYKIIDPQ